MQRYHFIVSSHFNISAVTSLAELTELPQKQRPCTAESSFLLAPQPRQNCLTWVTISDSVQNGAKTKVIHSFMNKISWMDIQPASQIFTKESSTPANNQPTIQYLACFA
jgi:hypothetical protein